MTNTLPIAKFILFFIVFLFWVPFVCEAQKSPKRKSKELNINYNYSYIGDTIKCKRTPQTEWKKLSSIDNNLLSGVLNVESFLHQRKSGVYTETEKHFFLNLKLVAELSQQNGIDLELSDYEKEFSFYKRYPPKSQEQIRKERIKQAEKKEQEEQLKENLRQWKKDSASTAERIQYRLQKLTQDSIDKVNAEIEEQKQIESEKTNRRISAEKQKKAKEDKEKRLIVEEEGKKLRKKDLIQKYGQVDGELIFNKKVKIGWTKEMCLESWGKPKNINRTTTANLIHEQCVYTLKRYLYFENGLLTAIQD